MVNLINTWWGKKTIIGKILSYIYENEDIDEDDLKEFIEECGSKNVDKMYKELIRKDKEFTLVFKRIGNTTSLTRNAQEYINSL